MNGIAERLLAESLAYLRGRGSPLVDGFLSELGRDLLRREFAPRSLRVLRSLDRVVQIVPADAGALARLLAGARDSLQWGQTYSAQDFGPEFLDQYGWTELFGTRGLFASDTLAGGFLLLGPHIDYPDHHHVAEEVYIPLTPGTFWRRGSEDFVVREASEIIHHPSGMPHAMRTGAEPLLAFYLWRGGDLAQKSAIVGREHLEGGKNG